MTSSSPQVVVYTYKGSPFGDKLINVLHLKRIPYSRVDVSMTLPRPELSELLGVSYRRIPIVTIGADVYCDTSLIISALERRFPKSEGYPTLFPARKGGGSVDTGMVKAFAMYYADRAVFPIASSTLPYDKFPESFLKDRSDYSGTTIDVKAFAARVPQAKSTLASHLALVEEQLADGREWLFDTETPSLADVSVHFLFAWISVFRQVRDIFDPKTFPKSVVWLARMTRYVNAASAGSTDTPAITKISGADAAKLVCSKSTVDDTGFDVVEAERLGIELGQVISIAPNDTGRNHPTTGTLVGLNKEEFVISVQGSTGSPVHCHLPRLNFNVQVAKAKL